MISKETDLSSTWQTSFQAAVCEVCDWSFLVEKDSSLERCPRCFQAALNPLDSSSLSLNIGKQPELVLPFTLTSKGLENVISNFARGIPFAPGDLSFAKIQARLRRIYLPMWLVDADVQATWKAEAGFDYQVVSHQDQYEERRGGWSSRQVQEGRIRWELRLGKLKRSYENIPAPAMEEHNRLLSTLGGFDLAGSQPYHPESVKSTYIRLPNRLPEDAWAEARPAFQVAAAEDCRTAASSDHLRQFSWSPEFSNQNWTLLLMPTYTTYYQDDEGTAQPIFIHGQSGQISGSRRASLKRARQAALAVLGIGVLIFLLSLLVAAASVVLPLLLAAGIVGLTVSFLVGAGAIIPIVIAWWFNRSQTNP
jgi:hypothetical protein